jgi:hypothetical protein
MMTPDQVAEIKAQCRAIVEKFPGSSPQVKELQTYWQQNRPQMWRRLIKEGIAFDFPKVLEQQILDRTQELTKQGNPDAALQARMEILGDLMEPEESEAMEEAPQMA